MAIDNIVAGVRQTREAYAKQFNYDVYAMWHDLKERQQKSGRQGGLALTQAYRTCTLRDVYPATGST